MRTMIWLVLAATTIAGCQLTDENPDWDPQSDYPPWAYDAPFYYRPSEDLEMLETIGEDIGVYYTKSKSFFIRHPSGYQLPGVPRVGIWYSIDEGQTWHRGDYFGAEQTHFLFAAEADGPHWIRFVGPGQALAEAPPGRPHRIYVVDTLAPTIDISVDPPPYTLDDQGNEIPYVYRLGETVTLYWGIGDSNLDGESVRLGATFATFPHNVVWHDWPESLGELGSMQVEIPAEAEGGGLRFRLEGRDKAGNIGVGFTETLRIEGSKKDVAAGPADRLVRQAGGRPSAKPGWPLAGQLLRGGATRILAWLPEHAENYPVVQLQFSANDGRTWRTVADRIVPGQDAQWTVPQLISKRCRLRVVHIVDAEQIHVLAVSGVFMVDIIGTDEVKTD